MNYSLVMKMVAVGSSETSESYQITGRHIPEGCEAVMSNPVKRFPL
jgi:hypothetical protein